MTGKQLSEDEKAVSGNVFKLFRIDDRVAVVTGAARGIGRELALTFAGAGAKVVVADIAFEAGRKVASQISASGSQAIALKTDVSSEEDVKSMVQTTVEHFGKIDVLVNNAARGGGAASPESLSLNDWNAVLSINLTGVFLCCKEVGKVMIDQKSGSIVNMASVEGLVARAYKDEVAYGATKAAVIQITRELAKSWAKFNIRVNAIAPGYTNTEMSHLSDDPLKLGMIQERSPMKRPAEPQEICGPALFLACDASSYVTGHTLVVDGGWTIV